MKVEEGLEKMIAELLLTLKSIKADNLALKDELLALKARFEKQPDFCEGWLRPEEAAIALKAEGVRNARYLSELRRNGVFRIDKGEIRNVSRGDRPTWEYNIPKCRKALQRYFKEINH
ncbi:hypothetical protein Q2T42_30560 [Leptolyngbya boryana CZ1]|uniref:Uncharacterized protein n=1 Tax=Leptolyngbya boryana CZ1 TaxID=3060204 RepID=A0AA97AR07_LEPBY|nr:hypothetical protein [Leptolyngbya boryana]WNZ46134.1 hypothetical protein Q2T42_30560 [Leptolyngbya boryana CZ1]